ncbi:MAG: hypothetical protein KA765_12250 [Thermoflexales bacterium]|nr:hypothetical protein [Thermoflexales bacterium]
MPLPDFGQLLATADPITIFVAVVAGLLAFFLIRTLFRTVNFVFQLGCLVLVALAVLYILRSVLKVG